jgi:peptide/nickel transport system substrate-binding protein
MKKLRWPLLIVVLALIAIGVLLLSQPTTLLPVIPVVVKPATGGVYTEALVGSMGRLNPLLDLHNPADRDADRLLYSGLIRFDDRGLPQGDLAESWGISQDGKVYNFSLRPKAVWHDDQPVTSDDIIFTIDLMRNENSIIPADVKELWNKIDIKRLDDKTLQFHLPEPFAPFLDYLTFGVLPKHLLDGKSPDELVNDPFNIKPVGSGPYRFDHLIVESGVLKGIVLSASASYYGSKPFIEQFVFRYYPDSGSALEAYRKSEVMGIGEVTADTLPEVLKEENLNVHTGRLPELSLVFFNLNNPEVPFFKEAAFRRALLLGVNRQWMVDHLLHGQAIVADSPIFPGTWAYFDGIEHLSYDPDQAVSMLKDAGYTYPAEGGSVRANKDGKKLQFELLTPDDEAHQAIAQMIVKNWEPLGISVTITALPYDDLVTNHLATHTYQAALVDLNMSRSPDPDPYPFWHQTQSANGQNYSSWDDFQASEYLEQARVITDIGERAKYYRNFEVRFSQELPALPLYYPVYSYAIDSQVQGVSMGPLFDPSDRFATVTGWYLKSKRTTGVETAPANTGTPTSAP